MFENLENELNKKSEESSLVLDFCSVLENTGKTVTIESSTKAGKYENVIVLGNYSPKKGDTGVVAFAGKYKYPYFIPKFNSIMAGPSGWNNINTAPITGETSDFINFFDELDKRPIYKTYFNCTSERDKMWGLPVFIEILLTVGKSFYYKFNKMIQIGDISMAEGGTFSSHKGVGHSTGKGCDLNDVDATLDNVEFIDTDTKYKQAVDVLRIFKTSGIRAVIWDIQYSKYEEQFKKDFGSFIRTTDGSHKTHWHVSVIDPGQAQ